MTVTAVRGDNAAELIVGDEGRGIEPRAVERVFDRFYTGDTAAGLGTGPGDRRRARRADGRPARGRLPARLHRLHAVPSARRSAPASGTRRGSRLDRVRTRQAGTRRGHGRGGRTRARRLRRRRRRLVFGGVRPARRTRRPSRSWSDSPNGNFNAAQVYEKSAPGVVTVLSIFNEDATALGGGGAGQGSGFVISDEGEILTNTHVIASGGPRQRRRHAEARQAGVRRVQRPQPGGRRDRRLRRRRRRRPDQGRSRRPGRRRGAERAQGLRARRVRGRRACRRDRQPVRRGAVPVDRGRLGHRPIDPVALGLLGRQRDPDRRLDQPRQLRRPAAGLRRRGDRDQPADRDLLGDQLRRRLRDPRQRDSLRARPASRGRARSSTPTSGSRPRACGPSWPRSSTSTRTTAP